MKIDSQDDAAGSEPQTAKAAAAQFLQAALAGGPVPATQVSRMAHEHGLTAKAIRMGREALGVEIERSGFGPGGRSLWSLPGGHVGSGAPPSGTPNARKIPFRLWQLHLPKSHRGSWVISLT